MYLTIYIPHGAPYGIWQIRCCTVQRPVTARTVISGTIERGRPSLVRTA